LGEIHDKILTNPGSGNSRYNLELLVLTTDLIPDGKDIFQPGRELGWAMLFPNFRSGGSFIFA
jgi:hypothetical protein